jgi:hypothetical protein
MTFKDPAILILKDVIAIAIVWPSDFSDVDATTANCPVPLPSTNRLDIGLSRVSRNIGRDRLSSSQPNFVNSDYEPAS